MDDCIGPPTPPPTSTPTPEPTSSPISSDEPTTGPSIVFGAALVVDPGASPSPVAREAQGPAPPETWCLGGCDANEKCVGNQNHPQGVDDEECRPCLSGQTYWPCDGKCFISECQTWHCHLIKHKLNPFFLFHIIIFTMIHQLMVYVSVGMKQLLVYLQHPAVAWHN